MSLRLFTKPQCPFCDIMKDLLDSTGITYYTLNVAENDEALQYLKDRGHKMVPQLYYGDVHINTNPDTKSYTRAQLFSIITAAMDGKFPGEDSGIEDA